MTLGHLRVTTAAVSDVGMRREGNEDSYAVWTPSGGGGHAAELLLVVCDGMGGAIAGEVASRLAVEAVVRAFSSAADSDPGSALGAAVEAANSLVWEQTQGRPDLQGMGTTCTAVALSGDQAFVAHVGDSRAYLIRHGRIRQITRDHSLVAQLVASNQLTAEEALHDRRRNIVTRGVGIGPSVEVDVTNPDGPLQSDDVLLLCSDGLHTQLTDDELAQIGSTEAPEMACRELVRLANQRGGPDNITVVVARVDHYDPAGARLERSPLATHPAGVESPTGPLRRRTLKMLFAIVLLLALTMCALAWVVFRMMQPSRPERVSFESNAGATASWQ